MDQVMPQTSLDSAVYNNFNICNYLKNDSITRHDLLLQNKWTIINMYIWKVSVFSVIFA